MLVLDKVRQSYRNINGSVDGVLILGRVGMQCKYGGKVNRFVDLPHVSLNKKTGVIFCKTILLELNSGFHLPIQKFAVNERDQKPCSVNLGKQVNFLICKSCP